MTRTDLKNEWAWSQIEAYADQSLDQADGQRMAEALQNDPALRAALERARLVRRGLRAQSARATPVRLLWRLLGIPSSPVDLRPWLAVSAVAIAAVVAVGVWVAEPQAPELDRRDVAVAEFEIAMSYLQRTAEVTSREVDGAVAKGLRGALMVSRDSVIDDESENGD